MLFLRHSRAPSRSAPAARPRVWLALTLLALGACSSSHSAKSLKGLGIDDGASAGESTVVRVDADEATDLTLDTGAELFVPEGAVDESTRVGLRRIEDEKALQLIERLGLDQAVLSAPYAVTPYTDFNLPLELVLPISTRRLGVNVGFMILEDEDDRSWSLLGEGELVEAGFASILLSQGGIIIAVDLDRLEDAKPKDAGSGKTDGGTKTDGGLKADASMPLDAQDFGPDVPLIPSKDAGVMIGPASKVDLLFMIDNSGSMAEEQKKLADVLDDMVRVLTAGNKNGQPTPAGMQPEFTPPTSLHIGVVSSDMGVNGAQPQKSCGALSFKPDERNTATTQEFLLKPLGDDGVMNTSTVVAQSGIFAASTPGGQVLEVVPGDPTCANVTFPAGQRFIDYRADSSDPAAAAQAFNCIAKLGKNGCGLEQQLESSLKALTPPDSQIKFTMNSNGHGTAINPSAVSGVNRNFLREDAVLAVVYLTDEEDCSLPDASNALFDASSTAIPGEINVRCGLKENQRYLHDVARRYVAGLKALKPAAFQDRIIVASIVGIPVRANLGSNAAHSGTEAINKILDRPDMQFKVQRNASGTADEPVPTCISARGDGSAAPARRFLELTKAFGENGVVSSICEDSYGEVLQVLIDRIAAQLQPK